MNREDISKEDRLKYIMRELVQLSNSVYDASCSFYETRGEFAGFLYGNGHHMAQKLASKAQILYLNRLCPEDQDLVLPSVSYYRDQETLEIKDRFEHFGF